MWCIQGQASLPYPPIPLSDTSRTPGDHRRKAWPKVKGYYSILLTSLSHFCFADTLDKRVEDVGGGDKAPGAVHIGRNEERASKGAFG